MVIYVIYDIFLITSELPSLFYVSNLRFYQYYSIKFEVEKNCKNVKIKKQKIGNLLHSSCGIK